MTPNTTKQRFQLIRMVLALCALVYFTSAALADNRHSVVHLGNGVVVDTSGQRVFTMYPTSGIEAFDVSTGNSIWKSAVADRPVSVGDDVLLAQVEAKKQGVMKLAYVEAATGRHVSSLDMTIPDNVRARVTDSMDRQFSLQVIDGENPGLLYWKTSYKKVRGAQLSRNEAPAEKAVGFLAADFSKRTVKRVDEPPAFTGSTDYRAPLPAGAPGKRALYSQNQQHVVASSALSAEQRSRSTSGARYQWHVYTRTGNKLGAFESTVSFAPFVVVRNKLLYVTPPREYLEGVQAVAEPMSLLAVDLTTGDQAFKVAVRDVRFRGPFPP